ncbi:MAG: fibronectin type III domain-containing protein [Spirochaetota bacterium]
MPLEIRPTTVAVRSDGTVDFTGIGGAPDYSFEIAPGGAGEIDPVTGLYEAPEAEATATVQVVDEAGTTADALVFVYVPPSLSISPSSTSVARGGSRQFVASGGTGDYTFSLSDDTYGTVDSTGLFTADEAAVSGTIGLNVDDGTSIVSATVTISDAMDLTLEATNPTIEQGGSTALTALGGTGEYGSFLISSQSWVFDDGPGLLTGPPSDGNIGQYAAGASIGTVEIQVTDGVNPPDTTVITVRPATPANLQALSSYSDPPGDGPKSLKLTWSYDASFADGLDSFVIERSTVKAGPYSTVDGTVDRSLRSYVDDDPSLTPNTMYYYRISAVAGTYASGYAEANNVTN